MSCQMSKEVIQEFIIVHTYRWQYGHFSHHLLLGGRFSHQRDPFTKLYALELSISISLAEQS